MNFNPIILYITRHVQDVVTWTIFPIKIEFKEDNFHRHQWLSLNINKLWWEIIKTCERIFQQQKPWQHVLCSQLRAIFHVSTMLIICEYEWKRKNVYSFFHNPVPQSCFVLECEQLKKYQACEIDKIMCGFFKKYFWWLSGSY